jgi:formylglycine-generating enzyme required for sulfatase activity
MNTAAARPGSTAAVTPIRRSQALHHLRRRGVRRWAVRAARGIAPFLLAAALAPPTAAQEPGDTMVLGVPGTDIALTLAWIPAPEPFWMTIHEVTHDQFGPFRYRRLDSDAGAGSYDADAVTRPSPPYGDPVHGMGKGSHPAGGMTRLAALRYAQWLSEKTGRLFRLPTEAEWELACLAGGPGPYGVPSSAAGLDSVAWYEANSRGAFHPVAGKRPNAWGLHDMHGNVAEWVHAGDPRGRGVVRGGAFDDPPEELGCDARVEEPAAWKRRDPQIPKSRWWNTDSPHVGFRLIGDRDLEEIRAYWAELLGR